MSMNIADAIAAVVTTVSDVPDIGQVHNRRRVLKDIPAINAVLLDSGSGKIAGAFVSFKRWAPANGEIGRPRSSVGTFTTFEIRIELLRGVEDASSSEVTFRTVFEGVMRAINAGLVYNQASGQTEPDGTVALVLLANTLLSHYAEITFTLSGRVAV